MMMKRKLGIVLFLIGLSCASTPSEGARPVVDTHSGPVRGSRVDVFETAVDTFLGIPFAKPPTGERRFRRPEPVSPWQQTLDATHQPPSCAQAAIPEAIRSFENEVFTFMSADDVISEDCLYLNVWRPVGAVRTAVLVWIYGGGFSSGSITPPIYDGRYLSAAENVLVVSMQYRLGMFGFLYLGSEDAPGNQALLDQHLALKWIHDNIESFGGDPDRITIFGESAGGASVHLHALSNLPRYFHSAIMQSAPALDLFSYKPQDVALQLTDGYMDVLGCPKTEEGLQAVLTCISGLNHSHISSELSSAGMMFSTTLDNYFFTSPPHMNYAQSKHLKIMIGTNANEGMMMTPYGLSVFFQGNDTKPEPSLEDYKDLVEKLTSVSEPDQLENLQMLYRNEDDDYLRMLDGIMGDKWFTCPARDIADNFTTDGKLKSVYMYRLIYRSSACFFPEWFGVSHACEIDLVFGHTFRDVTIYKEKDKLLGRRVTKYWANFAKTGNPNLDENGVKSEDLLEWPKYETDARKYMSLDTPSLSTGSNLRHAECEFWSKAQKSSFLQFPNSEKSNDEREEL